MIEIKAGSELDLAVAKAIGGSGGAHIWHEHGGDHWQGGQTFTCTVCGKPWNDDANPPPYDGCLKRYSTDLNAAFEAGIKAGLFEKHTVWADDDGTGHVTHHDVCRGDKDAIEVEGPTVAVAICAAILKLKGAV